MNHASLFSGIGGFDLAAEWNGWNNVFNCEWEEFPRKVLKHHFPNAKQHEDIKDFNATEYRGRIDILSGGFPCQPFSTAGLRKGTEDDRHLWPEMLRVIGECQPRWVVGENVRGLVSWSDGLVLEEVFSDLENLGYSVQSFIVPACATGAPHRRDRVWIIAHAKSNGNKRNMGATQKQGEKPKRKESRGKFERNNERNATDTERIRLEHTEKPRSLEECEGETRLHVAEPIETNGKRGNAPDTDSTSGKGERINRQRKGESIGQGGSGNEQRNASNSRSSGRTQDNEQHTSEEFELSRARWDEFPTVPPICGGDDGLPKELDGITFSKWRRESIKAYGNAIVPQVAHRIFQSISDYESSKQIHK